jgi:hypothetical protein
MGVASPPAARHVEPRVRAGAAAGFRAGAGAGANNGTAMGGEVISMRPSIKYQQFPFGVRQGMGMTPPLIAMMRLEIVLI